MSVEYDLHLYGSPPEGMDSVVYWTHPKWCMPLTSPKAGVVSGSPPDNTQASPPPSPLSSPLPSPQRRFLTTLLKIFQKNENATDTPSPATGEEVVSSEVEPSGGESDATKEGSDAGSDGGEEDFESALAALFNEESLRLGEDVEGEGDQDEDLAMCPLAHLARLSGDLFMDADCPVLRAADDDDDRKRKVKFADDEGLPLTAVLVFEVTGDTDEEEGEEGEEGGKNLNKRPPCFRLTKSNKRRLLTLYNAKRAAAAAGRAAETCPAYRRYYKPYKEDYESHRMQATGAFSMVGF